MGNKQKNILKTVFENFKTNSQDNEIQMQLS